LTGVDHIVVAEVNSDVMGVIAMGVMAAEESQVAAQHQVLSLLRTIAAVTTEKELTDKAGRRPLRSACISARRRTHAWATRMRGYRRFSAAIFCALARCLPGLAGAAQAGAGRRPPGLEAAPVGFECIERVPGSFDRMF
jgi:hypothetical protein